MSWTRVPAALVDTIWAEAESLLDVAMEQSYTGTCAVDLYDAVKEDKAQLWTNGRSVALTEIVSWQKRKGLRVIALTGDGLGEWVNELDGKFAEFAKIHGCDGIEVVGRKGWAKSLGPLNYVERHTLLWRDLSDRNG